MSACPSGTCASSPTTTEDLEFLRSLGMRSAITVALKARGEVTGTLTLGVAWSGRRYRREDARFAWILSGRVALALDNSGLFADLERAERARAEIAETLQRGLLPSPLPHIPGWSIAAMYRPAGAENEVGGDFYDVFRVPGGWMLAIGDVTGRGAHAASITAVARYTLRTAAVLTDDPLVALQTLNRALLARGDAALCSLAAVTLSEDPLRAGAPGGRRPPAAAAGRRRERDRGGQRRPGARRLPRRRVGDRPLRGRARPAAGDRHRRDHRGAGRRRDASARRACGTSWAAPPTRRSPCSASRARCTPSPRGRSTTTWRCSRSRAPRARAGVPEAEMWRQPARVGVSRRPAMPDSQMALVERLYDCFNRRDEAHRRALRRADGVLPRRHRRSGRPRRPLRRPGRPARLPGRRGPGLGRAADHPERGRARGETLLVRGRVYARSRELGIRDVPVAWIWEVRDGRFVRGEVFPDPEQAVARFAATAVRRPGLTSRSLVFSRAARPAPRRAARASRSTIRPR